MIQLPLHKILKDLLQVLLAMFLEEQLNILKCKRLAHSCEFLRDMEKQE